MNATVQTGEGRAGEFVAAVEADLADPLGFRPYGGTLNLDGPRQLDALPRETVTAGAVVTDHCDGVTLRHCSVGGVRAVVLRPHVENYPPDKTEVVAPVHLRSLFELDDGDEVAVAPPDDVWRPDGVPTAPGELDGFDTVVFDLDGTLVDLDVDWPRVHGRIEEILADALDGPLDGYTPPEIIRLARDVGRYDELDRLLTDHETAGAKTARRLPLSDRVSELDCPVGVCTANALSAAERALASHGVEEDVDAVVARGTVEEDKPHPAPLLACLDRLGASPGNALFVGDERSDARTAVSAGSSFLHAAQLTPSTWE